MSTRKRREGKSKVGRHTAPVSPTPASPERVEQVTQRPLICYAAQTSNIHRAIPTYIDHNDLIGFEDLTRSTVGEDVDVFVISNGGSPEATERIVRLLRTKFRRLRFIVPANAYSAATLMCFAADEILMGSLGTLGPIDPQINGVPARAILRAFETIEERLKQEGPRALTAYMPLISKYDLHILELCKSAQELSKELARTWLSTYMLKCPAADPEIGAIVEFFSSFDIHKSHGRSIGRTKGKELGLKIVDLEEIRGLEDLVCSLRNQYELFFDKTSFYKVFENARGIYWGRQTRSVAVPVPAQMPPEAPAPAPRPGPPERSG
ncbi:MAG: hypothetical protein HY691_20115 [Chloroflexi bacterium]|nr:hypothetical protein [Chloroflexota bacterium]